MYPQENSARTLLSLDGLWKFRIDRGEAENAHWEKKFPDDFENLYVPASYNDQREDPEYRNHCGTVYYETEKVIPRVWAGQRMFLRFDAAAHFTRVFLNGELLMEHRCGFLPFEKEITGLVKPGDRVKITVSTDNYLNNKTFPIGKESGTAFFGSDNAQVPAVRQAKLWRGKVNLPNFDFFNYSGICRHVRIYTVPSAYISDITLVPDITGTDGIVKYTVCTAGDEIQDPVRIRMYDQEEKLVGESQGRSGNICIHNAVFWEPYPGIPYLYHARVMYGEDEYTEDFGIRTVSVEGTKFLINGKPFYFKGFGKHEDSFFRGRGIDECQNVKDVSLLHWIHANSFRTSHYPYAEEMYRLCDREGIVIIDETPAVGLNGGSQENLYPLADKEYHREILRDMIGRDKNHPSVVMWSLGNEPDTENFPEDAYRYWHTLYEDAHRLDPENRPVTLVCCQNDYTKDITERTMDVAAINRYYGWYNLSGDLDAACYAWNLELDFWAKQNKPVMVTEYGGDTIEGVHGTTAEMFTEEFQAEYYRRIDAEFDKRDFFIGEQCWCFADFGTPQGVMRPDGNRKGLFTRTRRPKLAAHTLRDRWGSIPNFNYKG